MQHTKKHFAIYLAGPDVFRTEEKVKETVTTLKAICEKYHHSGHFPLDTLINADDGDISSQEFSFKIFRANIDLIDKADAVVANLENFRGPNADDGTAFEIGYGFAKGKIIYGYSPTSQLSYKQLYTNFSEKITEAYKRELENTFPQVEDFRGNTANLMLIGAIHDSGGAVFNTFEECIADLSRKHS